MDVFMSEVQGRLALLLIGVYDGPDQINIEIELVVGLLTDTAEKLLPCVQPRRKTKWKDDTLSRLCAQSRAARAAWKEAGCPGEGPVFEEKCRLRRAEESEVLCSKVREITDAEKRQDVCS